MESTILSKKKLLPSNNSYANNDDEILRRGTIRLIEKQFSTIFNESDGEFENVDIGKIASFFHLDKGQVKEFVKSDKVKTAASRHRYYLKAKAVSDLYSLKKKFYKLSIFSVLLLIITIVLAICTIPPNQNTKPIKKINDNTNNGIVILSEGKPLNLNGISVQAQVYTVDNFRPIQNLTDNNETFEDDWFIHLKNIDYNTYRIMEDNSLPVKDSSFLRVNKLLNETKIKDFFAEADRRSIYLSDSFKKLHQNVNTSLLLFPKVRQKSLTVLTVKNQNNQIKKITLFKNGSYITEDVFTQTLNSIFNSSLNVPIGKDGKTFQVCMFQGEKLSIELDNGREISFTIEEIVNPIRQRDGRDHVFLNTEK